MTARRKLVAGNWKMNGAPGAAALEAVLDGFVSGGRGAAEAGVDVALCPPATLLWRMARGVAGTAVALGGQDCHALPSGAHTGDVSAELLAEAGARYVILGHSERRAGHGETDARVMAKVGAARRAGLTPILCVGETEAERDSGRALEIVTRMLRDSAPRDAPADLVVAYEPVWAIGTGRTPSLEDIAAMHRALRAELSGRYGENGRAMRLLYGGSVKPNNAAGIFALADVDGALVGGASLSAADFTPIIQAAVAAARAG